MTPTAGAIGVKDVLYAEANRRRALRHYVRALAGVASSPVDVLCIGDSITEGVNAGTIGTQSGTRYVDVLRRQLQTRYPVTSVAGGEGYIAGNQVTVSDRWTYVGSPATFNTIGGLGRKTQFLTTTGQTMTLSIPSCTGIDILWMGSSATGSFSWNVDAAGATTVNTVKSALTGGNITSIRGLTHASHSLVIAWVSGGSVVIEGVMVYDQDESSGVRLWEAGHSTYASKDYVNLLTTQGLEWIHSVAPGAGTIEPDLVLIAIGTNDYYFGYTPASVQANLTTLVSNIRARCKTSPSFVFVVEPLRADVVGPAYPWANYVAAMYAAAKADPLSAIGVCDLDPRFWLVGQNAPWQTPPAWISASDKVHPTDAGYTVWAHAVADYLEP